jgi:chromosome segregation ATPase
MCATKQWAAVALLSTASMIIFGCSSSGGQAKESTKAVQGLQESQAQLQKAQTEIDKAIAALDQLSSGQGDLKKSFENYSKAVADVEAAGDKARARWQNMQARQKEYVAKWQSELETIENPEVRASLEQRRAKIRDDFDKIKATAQGVRDAYKPFLSDLKEIQKGLSLDLSPAGVTGMKPAMAKAKTEGQTLKQEISELQTELASIAGQMGPSAK